MINITNKAECTGCGVCRDICPVGAIALSSDEEGFLYPTVDNKKCIQCDKCDRFCPVHNTVKNRSKDSDLVAYAAYTKDERIRGCSSSGGIFTEIATYIIANGGVVFGAAFNEDFKVFHIAIDQVQDINKIQGSKYVQSEIGNAYLQAKVYLDSGRMVFFTGTPCQISGLYNFLNEDYKNLYTQDLICHGVPSPLVWQKYVAYREKKAASNLRKMFFRDKKDGWKKYSVRFEFSNGSEYVKGLSDDLYMRSFLQNLTLRPSCYDCAFKSKHRVSDITLADFWGVEDVCNEMDDNKGTSLILLHSKKAYAIFDEIKPNIKFQIVDVDKAIEYNSAMLKSVPLNKKRIQFFSLLEKRGFAATSKLLKDSLLKRLEKIIKNFIKSCKEIFTS